MHAEILIDMTHDAFGTTEHGWTDAGLQELERILRDLADRLAADDVTETLTAADGTVVGTFRLGATGPAKIVHVEDGDATSDTVLGPVVVIDWTRAEACPGYAGDVADTLAALSDGGDADRDRFVTELRALADR